MGTLVATRFDFLSELPGDSTLLLRGVSWDDYEAILEVVGESRGMRIWYDSGRLQVMTVSSEHEHYKDLLHEIVMLLSLRLHLPILSFGSATIKNAAALKGVEPDHCFYVQTASLIGDKHQLDFATDPPPDVVIEIDLHHESLSKLPIYQTLQVSEIWRYDGTLMTIYCLEAAEYIVTDASRSLPLLKAEVLSGLLARVQKENQYQTLRAFEEWLNQQV